MSQKDPLSRVRISIFRDGDNLFVHGLYLRHGTVHLVPSLKPQDLIVEEGGRAYLKVSLPEPDTTTPNKDCIYVDILRTRDDGNIFHQTIIGNEGVIEFDPWDRV